MERYKPRETYLRQLTDRMGNGEVKIITGSGRSGKSNMGECNSNGTTKQCSSLRL